jgi:hypothetical protein
VFKFLFKLIIVVIISEVAPDLSIGLADIATKDLGQKLRSMCIKRNLEQENDQGTGAAVPIENAGAEGGPEAVAIGEL